MEEQKREQEMWELVEGIKELSIWLAHIEANNEGHEKYQQVYKLLRLNIVKLSRLLKESQDIGPIGITGVHEFTKPEHLTWEETLKRFKPIR